MNTMCWTTPRMSDYDFVPQTPPPGGAGGGPPGAGYPRLLPLSGWGAKVADGFQEVRHRIPLESLQDVFSVEELEEFDQRMQEAPAGGR